MSRNSMQDPLAYFLTWTTYGTWLRGDERGWVLPGKGLQAGDAALRSRAGTKLSESPVVLDRSQRQLVQATIAEHCQLRQWDQLAINCRSNHVHVVVAAAISPDRVMRELKSWCTRRLKELQARGVPIGEPKQLRQRWWTEGGSKRYLNDDDSVEAAILYTRDAQDGGRFE